MNYIWTDSFRLLVFRLTGFIAKLKSKEWSHSCVNRVFGWHGLPLAGLVLLLAAVPAFSQSCALCYTQAASSGRRMIQALQGGILILVLPPTLGSIGMIFVVYHKRNQTRDDAGHESDGEWKKNDPSDDTPSKDW